MHSEIHIYNPWKLLYGYIKIFAFPVMLIIIALLSNMKLQI
jgi:hypothetical protein